MHALAGTSDYPKVKPEQISVAPLPVAQGVPSVSALGGWNMLISELSDMQEEAWQFVQWMTGEAAQKEHALEGFRLPTLKSLYEDQEVLNTLPVARLGKTVLKSAKPRPVSPYYSDMSLEMAEQFNSVVKGEVSPEEAAQTLQQQLESIVEQAQ
jgi:multiple sugar transport system substrate-binding protein